MIFIWLINVDNYSDKNWKIVNCTKQMLTLIMLYLLIVLFWWKFIYMIFLLLSYIIIVPPKCLYQVTIVLLSSLVANILSVSSCLYMAKELGGPSAD